MTSLRKHAEFQLEYLEARLLLSAVPSGALAVAPLASDNGARISISGGGPSSSEALAYDGPSGGADLLAGAGQEISVAAPAESARFPDFAPPAPPPAPAPPSPALTGIASTANSGAPLDPLVPSANVRQGVTLNGSNFTLSTQIIFPTIASLNGTLGTVTVTPTWVAADGSSIFVVVPDAARTGNVTVSGGSGSIALQIVPTISDVDLNAANFNAGADFRIYGSGFTEGNIKVFFGVVEVNDTGPTTGIDVLNQTFVGGGFDRADNDALSVPVPAGAGHGPISVQTAGGISGAVPISVTDLIASAVAGTPANAGGPSANPGQTIRFQGGGFDASTDVIFPTIDFNGVVSNRAVNPDFVSTNRTIMEVQVPDDALTGNVRVIGAAGAFLLQIVPLLKLAERFGATEVRLLGSGFTENSNLTVNFGATALADTGSNIDVASNSFLSNDTIITNQPGGSGNSITVTTAGGTSSAVTISLDDPPGVGDMTDLAILTAGADAGRFVVSETDGTIRVLDPSTLALVRTITRPGASTSQMGLDVLSEPVTVGAVTVPAGSLVVVNAGDNPDRLYYLDPAGSGTILASIVLGGPSPIDLAGAIGVAYHPDRNTLFVLRASDLVLEINPSTGVPIQSFHTGFSLAEGDLAVRPGTGTLLISGGSQRIWEVDPATGRILGNYDRIANAQLGTIDLRRQGIRFQGFGEITGLAFDSSGSLRAGSAGGRILSLRLPSAPTALQTGGAMVTAVDGTPTDPLKPSANTGQRLRITGAGYNLFTEVEFPRVAASGEPGFVRVRADAAAADGTFLEVVVPDEAVTGKVKISGAPGEGLFLQVTPSLRTSLAADPLVNFGNPLENTRWSVFGTGLVEGRMRLSLGGVSFEDFLSNPDMDVLDATGTGFSRLNSRLDLTLPDRSLTGPFRVETDGGSATLASLPIEFQPSVGLSSIAGTASLGTAANSSAPSANTGQLITLTGWGFTSTSNILFTAVSEDGTGGRVLVRPTSVLNITQMTVKVPAFAVTGPVTVAGSAGSIDLQIVPTLNGIIPGAINPGTAVRLSGTGIPEGGPGFGQNVTYTFGAASVIDTGGDNSLPPGPNVFSALEQTVEIALNVPAGATGTTVTVTTAGGTASLYLADLAASSVAAEPAGSGPDIVGGTLSAAFDLPLSSNGTAVVSGRLNTPPDVDMFHLAGAASGGIVSISVTGAQGGNAFLRLFDESGAQLFSAFGSIATFVLPVRIGFYIGYSSYPNISYDPVAGTGTTNGTGPGDYSLSVRYSSPSATSLNNIMASANAGLPDDGTLPSANTGQSITLTGEGFTSATRVRFTAFNANSPQGGLVEHQVTPASVAADGLSLVVAVPDDAVTGVVRVLDEGAGLVLQIVPTLTDINVASTLYGDGSRIDLVGSGFVEGAQTLILGTSIGSGGTSRVEDLWKFSGPDAYSFSGSGLIPNTGANFLLPINAPGGPIKIKTLGGTSAPFPISFTGIASGTTSTRGTPAVPASASANVRQAITLLGSGFDLTTQIIFPIQQSSGVDSDVRSTRLITPAQVVAGGGSLQVIVPDDAVTGNIGIVGVEETFFLQIVPTLVQVFTPATFATAQTMTLIGSGFIENDVSVVLGDGTLYDSGPFIGPEVFNAGNVGAGFDRFDNDGLSLLLPPGASTAPIIIRTSGGSASLVSVNGIEGLALSGTPADSAKPSANPGQTIRILGSGITLSTEVIFPIIDSNGTISNRVLRPDLASVDGTVAEIRVPEDGLTGNLQVVGAAGSFALQIVPTLVLVRRFSGTDVRLLGSGFSDNSNLSVSFAGTVVNDTGTNLDVSPFSSFQANDLIVATQGTAGGDAVQVITAGGRSPVVTVAVDDPAGAGALVDLAIFPSSAGADAGRLVVEDDANGGLRVLDAGSLNLVRTITRPGLGSLRLGLDFLPEALTVQDPVRGAVAVPAGSLIVVNGTDSPDRLYYVNPAGAGTILADVPLGGPALVDEAGADGVSYHLGRHSLFVLRGDSDLVSEINPATGAALRSFHTGFSLNSGDIAVRPGSGTLLVAGSLRRIWELDPGTGRVLGNFDEISNVQMGTVDLGRQGVEWQSNGDPTGLAFDGTGQLWATTYSGGRIFKLTLPGAPTGIAVGPALAVAIDGQPNNSSVASANANQRIRILGSGYTWFTEVEFPRMADYGEPGIVRVRVDAVSADGTVVEVMVPDEAVSGLVRVSGAPGAGLYLQVVPTIRGVLPADPNINFDVPVSGMRWGFFGSGFVEGATQVTLGGISMEDTSTLTEIDTVDNSANGFFRNNGRFELTIPERALAGPLRVQTEGGWFETSTIPIQSQAAVGLSSIDGAALAGTAANSGQASANANQLITLNGFGFTTSSNIIFNGVAEDGTRGVMVVRPVTVISSTQMTVRVPALAVTGPVSVSGSSTSVTLQVVPVLNGISSGSVGGGVSLRLSGSGIPEGGSGVGQEVSYSFGGAVVVDNSGSGGPDVFGALGAAVEISLVTPGGASGPTVTVTTAGGSSTLYLGNVISSSVAAEGQGSSGTDGPGGSVATALDLSLGSNAQLTVTGRINSGTDVDLYHLVGVGPGGILSITASGAQSSNATLRIFDETGAQLSVTFVSLTRFILPARASYYLGYSAYSNINYNIVSGTGATSGAPTGDYSLVLRYSDPAATSLTAISATASSGVAADSGVASANTRQNITINGSGFSSATRIRFTALDSNAPQNGLYEREVVPVSVAADGLWDPLESTCRHASLSIL